MTTPDPPSRKASSGTGERTVPHAATAPSAAPQPDTTSQFIAAQPFPLAWLLVGGLGGFSACLLLVLGVMSWWLLRGNNRAEPAATREPSVAMSDPAIPPVVDVPPQQSVAAESPPPSEPAERTNPSASDPSPDKSAEILQAVAVDVAKEAEAVGAPPEFRPGKVSVLGTPGTLDALTPPAELPRGMLAFLHGLDQLHSLQPAKAISHFDDAIAADDENSNFFTARGAAYVLSEKLEPGAADLQRALKLDPKNVLASRLTRLGWLMAGDQLKASKFHGHGGHADIDFLITEVGVGYGSAALAARNGFRLETHDQLKVAAALQKLPTLMRLVASSFQTGDEDASQALFALGVSQIQAREYAAARRCFEAVLAKYPYDWTARYYFARCVLETGDPEAARGELTYLLCWSRFLPEAFAARALCAARQNDIARAERDLSAAKRLDPAKAAEEEEAVAQAQSQASPAGAEADAAHWDRLLADARKEVTFADLTASALELRRSVDARRRRWDEIYQDRLFELVSAARAKPGDADRLADAAEFLRESQRVLSLQVAPNTSPHGLRRQTEETAQHEIELAFALAEEGLQANPQHARSWAVKSAILLHTYGRLTEAEKSAEYAIQFDPQLIAGHMALSDCCKEYAARLRERAAALRAPKPMTRSVRIVDSQGNFVRTDSETYYVPASPEELALAAECDRQAELYEQKEQVCLNNALAAAKGTPQEPFYWALLLYLKKDYQGARGWLEKAVAQNPEDPIMRHRLASCLKALKLDDESTDEFARAVNLQHTTGEVWLAVAWTKLERNSWKDAAAAIRRARDLDPADARAAAFQAILEEFGSKDAAAAEAAVMTAMAQEEARAQANRTTFLKADDASRVLAPDDVGLTMMLRLKAGKRLFATKPAAAAAFYLATAGLEPLISEWNLAKPVATAMLPFPDRDPQQIPAPPPLVAVLKNNRIYAGQALLNAKRGPEAAAQFAAAENFANRLPAGGTAYLEFELESQYVPFRVSSMPIYVKLLNGAALIQQGKKNEARIELQQVRFYLANRSLEQRQMTDDPIPAMYERLAPAVGLR